MPRGVENAADEAELVEQIERRVDRGRGKARERGGELAVHLLRREVTGRCAADVAVHEQPRHGHALPALAQGGDQLRVKTRCRQDRPRSSMLVRFA